jgi:hypothetical protein
MDINKFRPDPASAPRIDGVTPVRDDARPAQRDVGQHTDADHGDTVEISEEARARAAQAGETDDIPSGTLPSERLTELRRLIVDRVHDSDQMADEVMRRIVDSGDLG